MARRDRKQPGMTLSDVSAILIAQHIVLRILVAEATHRDPDAGTAIAESLGRIIGDPSRVKLATRNEAELATLLDQLAAFQAIALTFAKAEDVPAPLPPIVRH